MDRLLSMEVFVKVADLGSFSAAADQLGLSKSAVSKHVVALEERLGLRLINRTTRRLALTEPGSAFRDSCARIALEVAEAEAAVASEQGEPRGRLRVNAPMTFGFLHLSPLLPEFVACYPGIALDLTLNDRYVDLVEEGYDVAVRIGRMRDSSLISRSLASSPTSCAASPAYLAAHGAPNVPGDLMRHNCLRYTYRQPRDAWRFHRGGDMVDVRVRGNLSANNGDALRAAALGGLGVVTLPDFIIGDDLVAGNLVRLLPDWQAPAVDIHAVYPPQRPPAGKVRAFVDFLVEKLAREAPPTAAAGPTG